MELRLNLVMKSLTLAQRSRNRMSGRFPDCLVNQIVKAAGEPVERLDKEPLLRGNSSVAR
jgi:hypothetical protein